MKTASVLRKFLLERFPLARRRNISDEEDLLEKGIIDSLGVLEIVNFLQQEFSLVVEDDDLTPENFKSVVSIAAFVERRSQMQQEVSR
jgi:acyl carrier protein